MLRHAGREHIQPIPDRNTKFSNAGLSGALARHDCDSGKIRPLRGSHFGIITDFRTMTLPRWFLQAHWPSRLMPSFPRLCLSHRLLRCRHQGYRSDGATPAPTCHSSAQSPPAPAIFNAATRTNRDRHAPSPANVGNICAWAVRTLAAKAAASAQRITFEDNLGSPRCRRSVSEP